jgi:hypothetical protein
MVPVKWGGAAAGPRGRGGRGVLLEVGPIHAEVWRRLDAVPGDLSDILDVANRVATVDGPVNELERAVISELQDRCRRA